MPVTITLSQNEEQNLHMGLNAVYIFLEGYADTCGPLEDSIHAPLQDVNYKKQFSKHFENLVNECEITTQNIPTMPKEPQDSSYYKKLLKDIQSAKSKAEKSVASARAYMNDAFTDIEKQKNDIITSANGEKNTYKALQLFEALQATVNRYTENINKLKDNLFDKVKAQPENDRLSAPMLNGKRKEPQAKEDSVIFYNKDLANLLQSKLKELIEIPRKNSIEDRVNITPKYTEENPEFTLGLTGLNTILADSLEALADIQEKVNVAYSEKAGKYKARIEQIDSQLKRLPTKDVIEERIKRTIEDNKAVIQKLSTLEREVKEKLETVLAEEEKARIEAEFKAKRDRFAQQLVALYQGLQKSTTTKELPAITDFVAHITNKVAAAKENSSLTEEALLARILSYEPYITGLLKYLIDEKGVLLLSNVYLAYNDKTESLVNEYTQKYSSIEKKQDAIRTSITNMIDSSSTPNRVFELQKALLEMEQAHNEALLIDNGYPGALDKFDKNLTKLQAEITLYENNVFKPLNQLKVEFNALCQGVYDDDNQIKLRYTSLISTINLIQENMKKCNTENDVEELKQQLIQLQSQKIKALEDFEKEQQKEKLNAPQVKQEKSERPLNQTQTKKEDPDLNEAEIFIEQPETKQEKSDRLTCAGMLLAGAQGAATFAVIGGLLGGAAGAVIGFLASGFGAVAGAIVGAAIGAGIGAALGGFGFMKDAINPTKALTPNEASHLLSIQYKV